MIDEFFPTVPARILIGAAGGGRESFILAERGYDIVAFDPSKNLSDLMAAHAAKEEGVEAFRAAYEDLPYLFPAGPIGVAADLREMPTFDAAILGWGSLSHISSVDARRCTLQIVASVTEGPILVSFYAMGDHQPTCTPQASSRRPLIRGRRDRGTGDHFSLGVGFHHHFTEDEVFALAREARLEIAHVEMNPKNGDWPHAVFLSAER